MTNDKKPSSRAGYGLAIGVAIGVALGIATHNIAIGIAIGAGVGLVFAFGADFNRRHEPPDRHDDDKGRDTG